MYLVVPDAGVTLDIIQKMAQNTIIIMKRSRKDKIGSPEIYQEFTQLSKWKDLYDTNRAAFQKIALEWDRDYRQHIKAMIANYNFRYLGDNMTAVLKYNYMGWNMPRYLLKEDEKTGFEFISEGMKLLTINPEDIDWHSLRKLPDDIIGHAKSVIIHIVWTLNPDGMFFMDEDGYGMETGDDGIEVRLIGYIDRNGSVVKKFRYHG